MKKSLSVFFGAALLASCSVDDGIDTNPVASVNPDAPVFSVSFDNDKDTRAQWVGSATLKFDATDRMSLYHGVKEENLATFTGYGNAVYATSAASEAGEAATFSTAALVQAGKAIMAYPAELKLINTGSSAPVFEIEQTQPKEYRLNTPHMSEVINIKKYIENKSSLEDDRTKNQEAGHAGYGNQYDIVMKRVGMSLILDIKLDGEAELPSNAPEMKVMSVAINNGDAYPLFTKKIAFKSSGTGARGTNWGTDKVNNKDVPKHQSWAEPSVVDQEGIVGVDQMSLLTTNDIIADKKDQNHFQAVFTLLPFKTKIENDEEGDDFTVSDDITITVKTNYGEKSFKYATTKDGKEVGVIGTGNKIKDTSGKEVDEYKGVKEELTDVFGKLYATPKKTADGKPTSIFNGEKVGKSATRYLTVKKSELELKTVCIEDEDNLVLMNAVITALGTKKASGDAPIFKLAGDANGQFILNTQEGVNAFKQLLTAGQGEKAIKLALCNDPADNHICNEVVFNKTTTGTDPITETDVPNLIFEGEKDKDVNVAFNGEWNLGKVYYKNVVKVTMNGSVKFDAEVSALDPDATGNNKGKNLLTYANAPSLEIAEGATATLKASTDPDDAARTELNLVTTNYGTITVGAQEMLRMGNAYDELKLTNAAKVKDGKITVRGTIKVGEGAVIGAVEGSKGTVVNLGIVDVSKVNNATILLAANQIEGASVAAAPNESTNIFGIIDCGSKKKPASCVVKNKENREDPAIQGFIKSTNTAADANINYLVVDGTNTVNIDNVTKGANDAANPLQNVKYVELQKVGDNSTLAGKYDAVVINKGVQVTVQTELTIGTPEVKADAENNVEAQDAIPGALYLKGRISRAGVINRVGDDAVYVNYFGGAATDKNNITSM